MAGEGAGKGEGEGREGEGAGFKVKVISRRGREDTQKVGEQEVWAPHLPSATGGDGTVGATSVHLRGEVEEVWEFAPPPACTHASPGMKTEKNAP